MSYSQSLAIAALEQLRRGNVNVARIMWNVAMAVHSRALAAQTVEVKAAN